MGSGQLLGVPAIFLTLGTWLGVGSGGFGVRFNNLSPVQSSLLARPVPSSIAQGGKRGAPCGGQGVGAQRMTCQEIP